MGPEDPWVAKRSPQALTNCSCFFSSFSFFLTTNCSCCCLQSASATNRCSEVWSVSASTRVAGDCLRVPMPPTPSPWLSDWSGDTDRVHYSSGVAAIEIFLCVGWLVVAPSAALRLLQHQFDLVIIFVNQASKQKKNGVHWTWNLMSSLWCNPPSQIGNNREW